MPSPISNIQQLLQLHLPRQHALIIQKQRAFDLEPILHESDHARAAVPPSHELDGRVVFEEVVLAQPTEELVLMDEAVQRGQLALTNHTIATDRDIIPAFFLL
jgi:hypothetical protein